MTGCLFYNREACTSAPGPEAQANELVLSFVRFIDVCNEEQIRLAPNKCMVLYNPMCICLIVDVCLYINFNKLTMLVQL